MTINENPDMCAICLDQLKDPQKQLCGHSYCYKCIIAMIMNNSNQSPLLCPLCRTVLPNTERRFVLLPSEEDKKLERLACMFVYTCLIVGIAIILLCEFIINQPKRGFYNMKCVT